MTGRNMEDVTGLVSVSGEKNGSEESILKPFDVGRIQ